jgi:hypothetical protein
MDKQIFNVIVTETLQRTCEIEAETEDEALEILEEKYYNEEIVLDYQDLIDTDFSNCRYSKKEMEMLNEIHWFCQLQCCEGLNNCSEDECVLFRIEKIIEGTNYAKK